MNPEETIMNDFPLHRAAKVGDVMKVRDLIKEGMAIDNLDNNNNSPLLLAADGGHQCTAEILIDAGADVSRQNNSGTILHYASKRGWLQIVKKVLQNKPSEVNVVNSEGSTPLRLAYGYQNHKVSEELLKAGALVKIENKEDKIPSIETLHEAAESGNITELEHLIELGFSIESRHANTGHTVLHRAGSTGQLEVAKFLISKNCDINAKACTGDTPLLLAMLCGEKDFVNLLIKAGADVNAMSNGHKIKVLHHACQRNWKDTVQYIIESGKANLDAKAEYGWTPLLMAVDRNYLDVTKLLLQAGANVHACTCFGATALQISCRNPRADTELVKALLVAGADPNLEISWGLARQTPFQFAVEQNEPNLEVIKLLIQHGAYFRYTDNSKISNNNLLKEIVLKDVELCTQLIINKYNRQSLRAVYNNPEFLEKLPRMQAMNIKKAPGVREAIAGCVESEIATKTYCDVMKLRPTVLTLMCVEALINSPPNKKRLADIALLKSSGSGYKRKKISSSFLYDL